MIQTLQLHNFKIFKDSPVINLGKLTLLTGTNGRGKSSFIQPFVLLAQSINETEDRTPLNLISSGSMLDLGPFKDILNKDSEDGNISFSFTTDAKYDSDYELTYQPSSKDSSIGEMVSMLVDGKETFSKNTGFNLNDESTQDVTPPTFSGYTPLMNLRKLFYVSADRIAPTRQPLSGFKSSINSHGSNILKVIFQQGSNFKEELRELMSDIFDGATIKIDDDGDYYQLFMDSRDNGSLFHSINVGYGYSYTLLLLTSVMLAKKDDLVIIENPEAHLHPSAQARLMTYLINKVSQVGAQIIIETHSDHVVNGALVGIHEKRISVKDLDIVFFDRNGKDTDGGLTVENLTITGQGTVKNPPRNFCDQYAMDLKTLMGF